MKLAEALLLRADINKKLASLKERIARNAVVQQGERPHEDPIKLLKEAAGAVAELHRLILKINTANFANKLTDGRTLAQAISQRDDLVQHLSLVQAAIAGTHKEPARYSLKEIKWVATVPVSKLQKQADDLSKKVRELNAKVQEANWKAEVK